MTGTPCPSPAGETLVELADACLSRDGRVVLHDISCQVAAGEIVAVLGPNGAGKSTLLSILGGILPLVDGTLVRRGSVAMLMQSPGLARRSVRANVEAAMAWWGVPRPGRRQRADEALAAFGVSHLAQRNASTLSGGEQRRVHLARGLAVGADVLLLDEPFAGLDVVAHRTLCDDLADVLRTPDTAAVVVVHDRAEAWALADRLILLLDGKIAASGAPDDVLQHPPTAAAAQFLGYDGCLVEDTTALLTRPGHVVIDSQGDLEATVTRVVHHEDSARVVLRLPNGELRATDLSRQVKVGDHVTVRVTGGARFPVEDLTAPL